MNTYNITITTQDDTVEHNISAMGASVNYQTNAIEVAYSEGNFSIIRIPDDWVKIDAEMTLAEEPVAANQPVPPPVTVPPGQ